MAVTKRKSFKKSVKKDMHTRKRNSKTRKHRKTIRHMKGGGIFGNLFRRKKGTYNVVNPDVNIIKYNLTTEIPKKLFPKMYEIKAVEEYINKQNKNSDPRQIIGKYDSNGQYYMFYASKPDGQERDLGGFQVNFDDYVNKEQLNKVFERVFKKTYEQLKKATYYNNFFKSQLRDALISASLSTENLTSEKIEEILNFYKDPINDLLFQQVKHSKTKSIDTPNENTSMNSVKKKNNTQNTQEKLDESIINYAQKFHAFFIDTQKNTGKKVDIMGEGDHPLAYYMTEYANRNLSKTTRTNLEKNHPKFEQEIYEFETNPTYKNLYIQAIKHANKLILKFLTIHANAQRRKLDKSDFNILLPDINKLLLESLYHFITKYRDAVTSNTLHETNIFEKSGNENIKDTFVDHFR